MTGLEVGLLIQPVNVRDWDRYEAGAFGQSQVVTDAQVWDDIKRTALLGEPLGFDTLWMTEHHRTPYGLCPNPLQFLAYIGARTERIALGAAVIVLPWHDPVRVAEDIAQLDNLLGDRRIRIGFGRGTAASEYEHLRIDQTTARERFDEGIEIICAALTQEGFSYEGRMFRVPPTSLRPRLRNPRVLDDFVGAFFSEPSLRSVAKSGLGMCFPVYKPYEQVRADANLFNSIRAEQGLAPKHPMIVQLVYCAETDEAAKAAANRYINEYYIDANRHYQTERLHNVRGYEHYRPAGQAPDVLAQSIWGTPERCLAQIRNLQKETGMQHLMVNGWYGEMSVDEAERSLRLFAREVMPKLK